MIARDKIYHFIAGIVITIIVYMLTKSILIGFICTSLIGTIKEMYDELSNKGTPEILDYVYTILGSIIVCIIINT